MIDAKKVVIGGLTAIGLVMAGYRMYELRKLKKSVEEDRVIEIEVENVESTK